MSHKWIPNEHHDCANASEERVHDQLKNLERQGVISRFRHAYSSPQHGENISEESRKIDFVIVREKETIHLQVKEGQERAAQHTEHYPDIPCIIIRPEMTGADISRKLLTVFKRILEGQKSICV